MRIGKVQYNGVSSDTLGVFVSGSGSYDAAEYDVTNYQVMGRNGDIIIPNNRYKNIDVTYPCFIPSDFETRVQAVRNWMRSARSYARIEDNYDLLHYRMGIGKGVLKFSPAQQSIGANAQLVFNCKPQRFLKSGEEEQDVVRTPYSFTGDTVEFETDEVKSLEKAEVTISPSQNGTPWVSTTPDTEPYLYRALPSNVGNSELDTLVGGTVNWNQLVQNGDFSNDLTNWTKTGATATVTDGIVSIQRGNANGGISQNIGFITGHKYLAISRLLGGESLRASIRTNGIDIPIPMVNGWQTVAGVISGDSTQTLQNVYFRIQSISIESILYVDYVMLFDLTAMFNPTIADYIYTLESGTAGAGVAWLKKYGFLTKDYYAYDAGSLLSVKTSAHVMRDADDNVIGNYPLDSDLELRGTLALDANNNLVYDGDVYPPSGNVTRKYGTRAYQSGDESLADAITDGTNTVYKLNSTTTESADPYTSPQSVSDGGTEEYVDSRTVPMPVGHRSYYANIVPITGETGANLIHTGVNLLGGTDLKDAVVAYIPTASVDTTNKYVSFASGSATNGDGLTEGVPFKENTRYTLILTLYKSSGTGSNLRLYYTDNSYDDISVSAAQTKETVVIVSDANKTVYSLRKRNSSGTTRIYYEESGIFEGVLTASQFTEYQGTTYNVTFTDQGTVYGGTYDFVSGTLRVTYANIASYNGETIGTPWLSSYEEYSIGATPTTGAQVVYPLASPQTYTLTPNVINSVLGLNYVWSDYPPVSVGYSDPFDAHNPTQYEAKPLLKLENPLTGAVINVNAFTITATTSYTGVVEIDCESQNIYSGDTNLNSIFTVANFPVLGEGKNVITFSDADSLKIVPRWWEL